jgi:hypothetical protein
MKNPTPHTLTTPSTPENHPKHRTQPTARFAPALARTLALAGCCLASLPASAAQLRDDFNDGNDTGWVRYDPIATATGLPQNTFSFPSGAYRLEAKPTPNATLGPGRVGSLRTDLPVADFELSVDLVNWNDSLSQAMALVARVQTPGPGTTKGYVFGYVSGAGHYAQIVRLNNEGTASIAGSLPFPYVLDTSKDYRMVFRGRGSQLEGRIFELPNLVDPIISVAAVDNSFTEGNCGLIAFSLNRTVPEGVDVTFDNFAGVDTIPPTLEIIDRGFGLVEMRWPGEAAAFKLESSDTLPGTSWTPVDESRIEYFANIDRYIYQHDASTGSRFFRLRLP